MARLSQLRIESNAKVTVSLFDFKGIIKRLKNNPQNQAMVYDVFHMFTETGSGWPMQLKGCSNMNRWC